MKRNKITVVLLAIFIALFTVSSASAYVLNARSEEMTANSTCDFAGTIQLFFNADDQAIISQYLAVPNPAVALRVSLSGTDIALGADAPILCKDISGSVNPDEDGNGIGDVYPTLPIGMVALDELGIEVSNLSGAADLTAFVKGNAGQQYFTVYIVAMAAGATNIDPYWLKVGLWDELKDLVAPPDGRNETTAICADVHDFSGFSKLTVSIDNTPQSLTTTTSENQIGHFLVENIELRPCDKIESQTCSTTKTIQLCEGVEGQSTCLTGSACFVADGDLPETDSFVVDLRTNGETSGANTQAGVYITNVSVSFIDAKFTNTTAYTVSYYNADMDPDVDEPLKENGCDQEAILARLSFPALPAGDSYGSKIQFCVTYGVKPELALAGTKARIWTKAFTLPCGDLWTSLYEAADLVECGGTPTCMYFPYVVSGIQPWAAGVVVTNLASASVPADDMIVTFTMTDALGTVFTATKEDFTSVVYSFVVDDVLEAFGWAPAAGNAWLKISTNFEADGYSFLTNGNFGAGTLPRQSCSSSD